MGAWVERLFNEHKLVRRLLFFWALGMITTVSVWSMAHPMDAEHIHDIILAVIGLLSLVVSFYQWSRAQDDKRKETPCLDLSSDSQKDS